MWAWAQISPGAIVGTDCVVATRVSIGANTVIGDRVKIQSGVGLFGARIGDGVMLAPNVQAIEDAAPRAVTPDGQLKTGADCERRPVTVKAGASVGANSVLLPGVVVGCYAMIGAGSVVGGREVPDHALMLGNPARHIGWVCFCGTTLDDQLTCPRCRRGFALGEAGMIAEITNDHDTRP